MGRLALALGSCERALALDRSYRPSAHGKTPCPAGRERWPEAGATQRAALARAAALRDRGLRVTIPTERGGLPFALQRFDQAGACRQRALAVDPEAVGPQPVWHDLRPARERQDWLGRAVAASRRALAVAPEHIDARAALARLGG